MQAWYWSIALICSIAAEIMDMFRSLEAVRDKELSQNFNSETVGVEFFFLTGTATLEHWTGQSWNSQLLSGATSEVVQPHSCKMSCFKHL